MVEQTEKNQVYGQLHITAPIEDIERWKAYKEKRYNGLNAMSKMIRDFVNRGIDEEEANEED